MGTQFAFLKSPVMRAKIALFQVLISAILLVIGTNLGSMGPSAHATQKCDLSYWGLGQMELKNRLSGLIQDLKAIEDTALPHDVIEVRKTALRHFRGLFDIFIYAYIDSEDIRWREFRKHLNQGYSVLGEFKDLYIRQNLKTPEKANYDQEELNHLRDNVLSWRNKFLLYIESSDIENWIKTPRRGPFDKIKNKKLSQHYWGSNRFKPFSGLTGYQNLSFLAAEILYSARGDYTTLAAVNKVVKKAGHVRDDYEDTFHNFRKRLRSITLILELFPAIYPVDELSRQDADSVLFVYKKLGKLNDKIVAYENTLLELDQLVALNAAGDSNGLTVSAADRKRKGKRDKINNRWDELKTELKSRNFGLLLDRLIERFHDMEFSVSPESGSIQQTHEGDIFPQND